MKSFVMFLITLLSFSAFAQFKIGPRVGLNLSNVKSDVSSTTTNILTGYSVGGVIEKGLGEAVAVQLSVLLSKKGCNFLDVTENKNATLTGSNALNFSKSSVVTSRGKKQFMYVDVPVNFIYKKDLGIGKILIGLGAYYSYNLWGVSDETDTYVVGASSDLSLSTISGKYDLRDRKELASSDFGLIGSAGLEFSDKAQLMISYNYGLSDIDPGPSTLQNRTVNLSFAYFIKR